MKELKNRILEDGKALNETVLKVDTFLNHHDLYWHHWR